MCIRDRLTAELHAETYVRFLGKQTQDYVAAHLTDYDLFVQPSRWEGFGLTVAEAMAAGVPVLVSEGQGPAEVTPVSYTHLRAHETDSYLVCRLLLEKKKKKTLKKKKKNTKKKKKIKRSAKE